MTKITQRFLTKTFMFVLLVALVYAQVLGAIFLVQYGPRLIPTISAQIAAFILVANTVLDIFYCFKTVSRI